MGFKESTSEKRLRKKYDTQIKINDRQNEEIGKLRAHIAELVKENENKDEIISSVMDVKDDLDVTVEDLRKKYKEYSQLISEIKDMKKVIDQTVFKGRWKLIRLLMR